jgi:hypothetical protein
MLPHGMMAAVEDAAFISFALAVLGSCCIISCALLQVLFSTQHCFGDDTTMD